MLSPAPLLGADGSRYVTAAGPVVTNDVSQLTGKIEGVITPDTFDIRLFSPVVLSLRKPSLGEAIDIADAINSRFPGAARADSPAAVLVKLQAAPRYSDFIPVVSNIVVDTQPRSFVIEGIPERTVIGFGVVTGLKPGDGDENDDGFSLEAWRLARAPIARNVRALEWAQAYIRSGRTAYVVVTGHFYPFQTVNSFPVHVAAALTAKNIIGGQLVSAKLAGAGGQNYANSSGEIEGTDGRSDGREGDIRMGGFAFETHPPIFDARSMEPLRLILSDKRPETEARVAAAINAKYPSAAVAAAGVVLLRPPFTTPLMTFLREVDQISAN